MIIGVDIGGTFTDFVVLHAGAIRIHKRLTTPTDPSEALLAGLQSLGAADDAAIIHGSTVATNALLERQGARTALVTTRGFADVIAIGRQTRPDLYALVPVRPQPLVPRDLRFELDERIGADGSVIKALDLAELGSLIEKLAGFQVESVAVCLLFSFLDDSHEQQAAAKLREHFPVSVSSEILPEFREYERTSTTVINGYVSPVMSRYLTTLQRSLGGGSLRVMQSNGGTIDPDLAGREAARTVLSGPAGGVVGAFRLAQAAGMDHIITFDMGGTSTDVALLPGHIPTTREWSIDGQPLRLPVIDIHTVGAGGGSIARIDAGGALRVGPESAGADPGPAAYGRGDLPTVTDANVVLGRLLPTTFLGGAMTLHADRARAAVDSLGLDHGAWGTIQLALARMQRAVRRISVERGHDPRRFTLVAFGGAGPLHACELASALRIPRVLIPPAPGVLSALGMVLADHVRDYAQGVSSGMVRKVLSTLDARARADLSAQGFSAATMTIRHLADMRYAGQSHTLTVDLTAGEDFHTVHEQRFGYARRSQQVETTAVRVQATGHTPSPTLPRVDPGGPNAQHVDQVPVWFQPTHPTGTYVYHRGDLGAGNLIVGPAIITQLDTTTVVPPGWAATVDSFGNLVATARNR